MSDMFDPDEVQEIEQRLEAVVANENEGYEMLFLINKNDAIDLVEAYRAAVQGEPMAMARCWTEFGQIMLRLEASIRDTDY